MRLPTIMLLGCILGGPAWSSEDVQIRIRIQNYAEVPEGRLSKAQTVATDILASAGVEPIWLNCSLELGEDMDADCRTSPGTTDFFLRLLSSRMTKSLGLPSVCLGYALIPQGGWGSLATVFTEKARILADRALAQRSSVLGHAIAHEIGHLLIGRAEHSSDGLMQALWSPRQLLRATGFPMRFTKKDAHRLTRNALARVDSQNRT